MSDQISCPKCHTTNGIIEKPILVDTKTGELLYANKFQPVVMWGITIVFIPIGIYGLVVLTMAVARNEFSNLLSQVALAIMAFGFGSIGLRAVLHVRSAEKQKAVRYICKKCGHAWVQWEDGRVIEQSPLPLLGKRILDNEWSKKFFETTRTAWIGGKLASISADFAKAGRAMSYKRFLKVYRPVNGTALEAFLRQFMPREDEYMVGVDVRQGSFVLTNQRLIQWDGSQGNFREVDLSGIKKCKVEGSLEKSLIIMMKDGETVEFKNVPVYPKPEYIEQAMKLDAL